ncbi:MAG: ABC transporter substrate-binding protein [Planctomycetaceae bacterium]|nr:ABC transporter substrate-binding protein [Planctomycetaceae bacterium]
MRQRDSAFCPHNPAPRFSVTAFRFLVLAAILAVSFPIRSAAAAETAGPATIRVGVCLSMTGEFAQYGPLNFAGIKLFADHWNRRAAENGVRIELVLRDDKSDPVAAAAIVDEFADMGDIPVIIGPVTSANMLKMVPRARERKIPLVSPAATNPALGNYDDWAFRVQPGEDYQGQVLARFFRGGLAAETAAALVNTRYEYGIGLAGSFQYEFTKRNGAVLVIEDINWDFEAGSFDFSDIIDRMRAADPEVVLLSGYADEAIAFIQQASEKGWQPVFCGGDSWLNPQVLQEAGDSYYIGSADLYANNAEARRFVQLLDRSDDPNLQTFSIFGYDSMMVVARALQDGARTSAAIRDYLYNLRDFPMVSGTISCTRESGLEKTLYIYRISRVGDDFYSELVAVMEPEKTGAGER